jgi:hypothetical protein
MIYDGEANLIALGCIFQISALLKKVDEHRSSKDLQTMDLLILEEYQDSIRSLMANEKLISN